MRHMTSEINNLVDFHYMKTSYYVARVTTCIVKKVLHI